MISAVIVWCKMWEEREKPRIRKRSARRKKRKGKREGLRKLRWNRKKEVTRIGWNVRKICIFFIGYAVERGSIARSPHHLPEGCIVMHSPSISFDCVFLTDCGAQWKRRESFLTFRFFWFIFAPLSCSNDNSVEAARYFPFLFLQWQNDIEFVELSDDSLMKFRRLEKT